MILQSVITYPHPAGPTVCRRVSRGKHMPERPADKTLDTIYSSRAVYALECVPDGKKSRT
jgi:hypothetical protein